MGRFLSISDAVRELEELLESVSDSSNGIARELDGCEAEVRFVAEVMKYLEQRVTQGVASAGHSGAIHPQAKAQLGSLVPLHCGHNNSFADNERQMLIHHLNNVGWLDHRAITLSKPEYEYAHDP